LIVRVHDPLEIVLGFIVLAERDWRLFAQDIDRAVPSDRGEPAKRFTGRTGVALRVPPDPDIRILKDIFSRRFVSYDTKDKTEKFRSGLPVERLERRAISVGCAVEQHRKIISIVRHMIPRGRFDASLTSTPRGKSWTPFAAGSDRASRG